MSADLEQSLHKEISALSDEQQREVLAFVEKLKRQSQPAQSKRFSFIGIGHSGKKGLSACNEENGYVIESGIRDSRKGSGSA